MPQLNFSYYPLHMLWTFCSFFAVYCFIAYVLIPKFNQIKSDREKMLYQNIQDATLYTQESERIEKLIKEKIHQLEQELNIKFHEEIKNLQDKKSKLFHAFEIKKNTILYESIIKVKEQIILQFDEEKNSIEDLIKTIYLKIFPNNHKIDYKISPFDLKQFASRIREMEVNF